MNTFPFKEAYVERRIEPVPLGFLIYKKAFTNGFIFGPLN
jgi:hypothetical protein